jgi:hypothetical protein
MPLTPALAMLAAQKGEFSMNVRAEDGQGFWNPWRIAGWGGALALLLAPAIAMQFTAEVKWGPEDFVFAIILLGCVGLGLELAVRSSASTAFRGAVALALLAGFLQTWADAAVGIIGDGEHPANMMFRGITVMALAGCWIARFRPDGMARAMLVAGVAEIIAALLAATGSGEYRVLMPLGGFAGLWLLSAALFHKAATEKS